MRRQHALYEGRAGTRHPDDEDWTRQALAASGLLRQCARQFEDSHSALIDLRRFVAAALLAISFQGERVRLFIGGERRLDVITRIVRMCNRERRRNAPVEMSVLIVARCSPRRSDRHPAR